MTIKEQLKAIMRLMSKGCNVTLACWHIGMPMRQFDKLFASNEKIGALAVECMIRGRGLFREWLDTDNNSDILVSYLNRDER